MTTPKFDDMGRLLHALGEGYKYDEIEPAILIRDGSLNRFDILFLTCNGFPAEWGVITGGGIRQGISQGHLRPGVAEKVGNNLRQFVQKGGTLYVSDLSRGYLDLAFRERAASARFDPDVFRNLQDAERAWIKTVTPNVKPDTLSETLEAAGLSKSLADRHDELVALLERSSVVRNMPGLSPSQAGANLMRGFFFGAPTAPRLDNNVNRAEVAAVLKRVDESAPPADVSAVTQALSKWKSTINDAARARPKAKVEKAWPQISQASKRLMELRGRLIRGVRGAGKQAVVAEIEESGLKELLGDTLKLSFADNAWVPAEFNGQDVNVLMRGDYTTVDGVQHTAPLLVKFREGAGTIIFTSFHNEAQNSEKELDLLRYLVFTAVTAQQDAVALETMLSAGFSPVKQSQNAHRAGHPTVTRVYDSPGDGPLRFGLTVGGAGAKLRFTLVAPTGAKYENEIESTILVQATGAPAGKWTYTVEALKVPYENFPYNVSIGKGESAAPIRKGAAPKRRP